MTKELLKALETIKNECKSHKNSCKNCPLKSVKGVCGLRDEVAQNWDLTKKEYYL